MGSSQLQPACLSVCLFVCEAPTKQLSYQPALSLTAFPALFDKETTATEGGRERRERDETAARVAWYTQPLIEALSHSLSHSLRPRADMQWAARQSGSQTAQAGAEVRMEGGVQGWVGSVCGIMTGINRPLGRLVHL
mmetsp:Transcript_37045/g.92918  ORF Transcript_37045/g.92918 Transcript_37045/m.92918 type:complete len:137 (+) Transcript_37045:610-1020(+)